MERTRLTQGQATVQNFQARKVAEGLVAAD